MSSLPAPLFGRRIDVTKQRVVKLMPDNPPVRGEKVLVDGERCRVTRCKVAWDGPHWTIRSLYVKPRPAGEATPAPLTRNERTR